MGGSNTKSDPTPEQQVATELYKDTITTIQEIWKDMRKDPEREADTAYKIYKKLFSDNPEYRQLFREDMALLVKRLIMMMGTVVENLDDLNALRVKVAALGRRHTKYNVPQEAYGHFLDAILWGLKETMGEDFSPRAQYCFTVMFMWATNIMIESGKPLHSEEKSYNLDDYPTLKEFDPFMKDATCLEYFHLYLASELSEEDLLFYIDVMKYKTTRVSVAEIESKLKELSSIIFQKYIRYDGEISINLPSEITSQIEERLGQPAASMFDDAIEIVHKRLNKENFAGFLKSKTCQALCGAKSGNVKHSVKALYEITDHR